MRDPVEIQRARDFRSQYLLHVTCLLVVNQAVAQQAREMKYAVDCAKLLSDGFGKGTHLFIIGDVGQHVDHLAVQPV